MNGNILIQLFLGKILAKQKFMPGKLLFRFFSFAARKIKYHYDQNCSCKTLDFYNLLVNLYFQKTKF